jgi:predicted negative regulator of RcsB-dependent stress response
MISIDALAIGTPVAIFVFLGLLGFVEYRWIERAKKREQLAMAASEKISQSLSSTAPVDTRAAAE